MGAKVSVTQDWRLYPPSAVQGRRERKFMEGEKQSYFGTHNSNFWPLKAMYGGQWGQKLTFRCAGIFLYFFHIFKRPLLQVKPRL